MLNYNLTDWIFIFGCFLLLKYFLDLYINLKQTIILNIQIDFNNIMVLKSLRNIRLNKQKSKFLFDKINSILKLDLPFLEKDNLIVELIKSEMSDIKFITFNIKSLTEN